VGKKVLEQRFGFGRAIFDGGNGARDGADVSCANLCGPVFKRRSHERSIARIDVEFGSLP
jgi:hypothetical protein